MTHPIVIALPGIVLPETGPLRRHVRPPERRTELYLERYDRRTLIYDAVRLPGGGVCLTTPRLLNLWPLLRDGLRRSGVAVRRRKYLRCEQITLRGLTAGLEPEIGGSPVPLPLRASGAPLFAGMRVLMAVNKDNDLDWIADWARFHALRHGADGVLLFDNGSTAYSPEDAAARLSEVPGMARAVVVSAPFPYGPADKGGRFDVPPRFFQTAMLNLARRDFVAQARAVLSVDIDEMVTGPQGESIFAAAERHPLGMVTIPGIWVFPPPGTEGPVPQRAHLWQADPTQPCHQKWCIAPSGPMGRVGWHVHSLGGPLQPLFTVSKDFELLHCRATSTGWKPGRFAPPAAVSQDPEIAALFDSVFGNAV
ncbi:MAG: hypothetical protein NXH97_10165 [Rhodobacteraceae bacterium]|nr:hypothetical protein [Paracoccaceae bacterium]